MKPEMNILKQLEQQNLDFTILQNGYDPSKNSLVSLTVEKWKSKFIANRYAPHLESYLWHIFSYGATECIEGLNATEEYLKQWKTTVLIFNEPQQYLIECRETIPKIEMIDFFDDIYISQNNMKWTYVIPHEIRNMGPYFSTGN